MPSVPSLTVVEPGPEAGPSAEVIAPPAPAPDVNPFPVLGDVERLTTSIATEPAMPVLPTAALIAPTPVAAMTPAPVAPTPVVSPVPTAPETAPPAGLPDLPGNFGHTYACIRCTKSSDASRK